MTQVSPIRRLVRYIAVLIILGIASLPAGARWSVESTRTGIAISEPEISQLVDDQRRIAALGIFPNEQRCSNSVDDVFLALPVEQTAAADDATMSLIGRGDCLIPRSRDASATELDRLTRLARRRLPDCEAAAVSRLNDAHRLALLAYSTQLDVGMLTATGILSRLSNCVMRLQSNRDHDGAYAGPTVSGQDIDRLNRIVAPMSLLYLGLGSKEAMETVDQLSGAVGRCAAINNTRFRMARLAPYTGGSWPFESDLLPDSVTIEGIAARNGCSARPDWLSSAADGATRGPARLLLMVPYLRTATVARLVGDSVRSERVAQRAVK